MKQSAKTAVRKWLADLRDLSAFYVSAFQATCEALNSCITKYRVSLRCNSFTPGGDVLLPDKPDLSGKISQLVWQMDNALLISHQRKTDRSGLRGRSCSKSPNHTEEGSGNCSHKDSQRCGGKTPRWSKNKNTQTLKNRPPTLQH